MSQSNSDYEPTRPLEPYAGYEPTMPLEPYQPYEPYRPPAPPVHPAQPMPRPTAYPQPPGPYGPPAYGVAVDPRWAQYQAGLYAAQKSRLAAGLLGIFLGTRGVHNFYLGRTAVAVVQLLVSVLTFGLLAPAIAVWALIEGIMILAGATSFRTDAKGIPLRD